MAKFNAILRQGRLTEWPVIAGVDFEVGDLLYYDTATGGVKPMADYTWATSDSATRKLAKPCFVGVATETRTGKELVNTTTVVSSGGIYSFTMVSGTPMIGTLLGVDGNGSSTLYSTVLEIVTDIKDAIGYCTKKYAAATTTVECVLFSAYDAESGLDGRIKTVSFAPSDAVLGTSGNLVNGFTFAQMVKLTRVQVVHTVAVDATSVITLKNGSNALDDTVSVGSTASAVGYVQSQAISDANGYDIFDADDTLVIHTDGACTTGSVQLLIDYFSLPKLS